jgi:hypothetical protein
MKLPDDGVMLHIGAHKTGTTTVQLALFNKKSELLELGILYPGSTSAHNEAVARPAGYPDTDYWTPPDLSLWESLVAEVRLEKRRVVVSAESLCIVSSNSAQHIVEELGGERVHVLLSVRPLAFLLTSIWQEFIKVGDTVPLDTFTREMARGPYALRDSIFAPWIMADFADAVRRWRDVVGSNRLSVLMVEPNLPAKLLHDFEEMLSLPQGFLGSEDEKPENRSLTYHEAEFLRQINVRMWGDEPPRHTYPTVPLEVIERFLRRVPGADEERLSVPGEILEKMAVFAEEMRDRIVESGVNIIGDINSLMKMPPSRPEGSVCGSDLTTINMDIAVSMVKAILDPPSQR